MANFCSKCGSPAGGRFCPACGAAVPSGPPALPNAPAPGPRPTGSAAKVIWIVAGVVLALGAMGVGSVVYIGYRAKQKLAELNRVYKEATEPAGVSSSNSVRSFPPSKGSGCPILEGQEAAGILGVAVDRAEFAADGANGGEECRYWVNAEERKRLARAEIVSGISAVGSSDEKNGVENLIGGVLGAAIDAQGENNDQDFAFSLEIWRHDGKAMWDKLESARSDLKGIAGADVVGVAAQQLEGVGDRARILPAGHSIMVLKGDKFLLLSFQQFVPGREKTAALARAAVGRL